MPLEALKLPDTLNVVPARNPLPFTDPELSVSDSVKSVVPEAVLADPTHSPAGVTLGAAVSPPHAVSSTNVTMNRLGTLNMT